jgi:hypothetical protein
MCDQYLPGWHNVINHMLGLIKKKGLTTADVEKCLSSLVIPTAVVDTVKQVHDDLGYNVYILSDANTFWIDNVLKGSHCEKYEFFSNSNDDFVLFGIGSEILMHPAMHNLFF